MSGSHNLPQAASSRAPKRVGAAFARDTRGAAAIELALITPFMILLLMGVFDFGTIAYTMMQVNAAAFAGAQAGAQAVAKSATCLPTTISNAETSATGLSGLKTSGTGQPGVAAFAPTCAEPLFVNTSGSTSTLALRCTNTPCPTPVGTYAIAFAQASYTPLLPWAAIGLPSKISAVATARVK
jgi:Flp pilus assembly protein TadG